MDFQQSHLIELTKDFFKKYDYYSKDEILSFFKEENIIHVKNINSLTYNMWDTSIQKVIPLFFYEDSLFKEPHYQYLGPGFRLDDYIYCNQNGEKEIIGYWKHGIYSFLSENIETFEDWKNNRHKLEPQSDRFIDASIEILSEDGIIRQEITLLGKDGQYYEFTADFNYRLSSEFELLQYNLDHINSDRIFTLKFNELLLSNKIYDFPN